MRQFGARRYGAVRMAAAQSRTFARISPRSRGDGDATLRKSNVVACGDRVDRPSGR